MVKMHVVIQPHGVGIAIIPDKGERAMKEEYREILKNKKEEATITTDTGEEILIKFKHEPNVVGKRSKYTGLPIWVGKTTAAADGGTVGEDCISVETYCWVKEPFNYTSGRYVAAGRLLKKLELPTRYADQLGEYNNVRE